MLLYNYNYVVKSVSEISLCKLIYKERDGKIEDGYHPQCLVLLVNIFPIDSKFEYVF